MMSKIEKREDCYLATANNGKTFKFYDKIPRTKAEMDWAVKNNYVIPAFENMDLEVELLLDYVDLKLEWYIPSLDALDFVNFIRLCLGSEPENLNSKAHYFFIDAMFGSIEIKPYFDVRGIPFDDLNRDALILSSREFSKSTIVMYFILYMAAKGRKPNFGKVNFGMYVSDRMKGNVKTTMQTIEGVYMGSEYLQSLFEETHFTDEECWFIRKPQTDKEIRIYNKALKQGKSIKEVPKRAERMFKIAGLGCSGGRGSRNILDRPQFAIFDDLIANEKDAYSKAILESIDSTIEADVGSSLSGNGHFKIYIGTGYHVDDPICKRVRELAAIPVVFPKAEVAPHGDIYDKNGDLVKPALKEEDFVSVWPDRHTFKAQRFEYAKAELSYKKGNPKPLKTIDQEYYIRLTSQHERLIPDNSIKIEPCAHIWKEAKFYNWLITTDFTTTGNKNSDFSVALVWAMDSEENMYLMRAKVDKMGLEEQYENIYEQIDEIERNGGENIEVAVEIDGQQSLHLIALERFFEKRSADGKLVFARQLEKAGKKVTWEGIRSKGSGDKFWRLKIAANEFYRGKIIFSKEMTEEDVESFSVLMYQLKNATQTEIKTKNDDALDGISQISLVDRDFPTISVEDAREMQEDMGYNDYEDDPYRYGYENEIWY